MQTKKTCELVVTTGTPNDSGTPRAMVLTPSFVLSSGIGLSCPRRRQGVRKHPCRLYASVEALGPHDFTVRITRASSGAHRHGHRIPRPTFRDDREASLFNRACNGASS